MRAAMLLEPLPSTFACFFTPKVPLFCVKNSKRSGTFCYLLLKTKRSLSPFTVIHSKRSHRAKGRLGQRSCRCHLLVTHATTTPMTTWTWDDREWLLTNYNHPQLDTPPPDTFVRLWCMETGVDLLYNKFGISVQGQLVADRDHVARVFGDKCMGIHLFLHVGAKGWLGFAPQSILLVGTCLDGELAMETQQSFVIVDYTERMEFEFLSDQTAERRERANAANSNFRRQLNRHTQVKVGEGGNEFLGLLHTGWLHEAVAFAKELHNLEQIEANITELIQTLPGGETPANDAADSSPQLHGPFVAVDYAGPWTLQSMDYVLSYAASGGHCAVILHAATTPDVDVAEALKSGAAVWCDTLLPKEPPAPTGAMEEGGDEGGDEGGNEAKVPKAPPVSGEGRGSSGSSGSTRPRRAAAAPAARAAQQAARAPTVPPPASKKAKKEPKVEAKVEGSSRAVLGQQVRFKVDKLKQLLADGASEAEVTAAYTEVREDYPGKCEPSAVTAKKWDSTLKAAEVKYPTLAPSADAPAAAPHPVFMGAMAAFIQAETAKVAAKAAAEAVDKAMQQLRSANEQATLSQKAAAASASASASASAPVCLPVAPASPATHLGMSASPAPCAYPVPSAASSMHPSTHPVQPMDAKRQAIQARLVVLEAEDEARKAGEQQRQVAAAEEKARLLCFLRNT